MLSSNQEFYAWGREILLFFSKIGECSNFPISANGIAQECCGFNLELKLGGGCGGGKLQNVQKKKVMAEGREGGLFVSWDRKLGIRWDWMAVVTFFLLLQQ